MLRVAHVSLWGEVSEKYWSSRIFFSVERPAMSCSEEERRRVGNDATAATATARATVWAFKREKMKWKSRKKTIGYYSNTRLHMYYSQALVGIDHWGLYRDSFMRRNPQASFVAHEVRIEEMPTVWSVQLKFSPQTQTCPHPEGHWICLYIVNQSDTQGIQHWVHVRVRKRLKSYLVNNSNDLHAHNLDTI